MKILHVYNHFIPCTGGIENQIEGLCRNLNKLGHEGDVVCLNTCSNTSEKLLDFEEFDGIKVYRLPYVNLRFYKIAPSVLRLVKEYDVIHVHGLGFFSDFLALTKFLHKKSLVLSTHGGIFHTKTLYHVKKAYFEIWSRLILTMYNRIIAVSKKDLSRFSNISPNVVYIPNGVNIKDFVNLKRETEDNSFLFVGRISKNKRVDNLLNTFNLLKEKKPYAKLRIVGEDWGGLKRNLEDLVEEKGLKKNVIFSGRIGDKDELYSYYSMSDFFVSASEYEGFGISVLEAMASGVPVIVNNIDAFRELVDNNENGFIIDFSRPMEACNKISEIMGGDLSKIIINAKKTAYHFDWNIIIKDILKVYEEV